ncbi:MAG TPA: 50S ribosomal protein L25 [Planctomycetota bacterium]|jgi:large subunit ribosomal protein L25|nr:50S ribosomal protein L25 [Planctomycetota bacterium]
MAESFMIDAEKRDRLGTRVARRYRKAGKIPAVLARKGEAPLHLLVDAREFERVVKRHARIVTLRHPAGQDKVFIKEVQYDHLDEHMIHVDFAKVAMDELLTLEVPLVLKGKPVGVTEEGGVLDQYVKTLRIQCLPDAIPEAVEADVTGLKKDVNLTVKDLKPPAGVKILNEPDLTVAVVTEHKVEEAPAAAAAAPGPTEPEVIKKEKPEEGAEEAPKKEAPKKEEKK